MSGGGYGAQGERMAEAHLKQMGARILARNFRSPFGEIDLIAEMDGWIVFVEVKRRSGARYGRGAEAVGAQKQRHITLTAQWYIKQNRLRDARVRFDVAEILGEQICYIKGAFYAST